MLGVEHSEAPPEAEAHYHVLGQGAYKIKSCDRRTGGSR